MHLSVADEVYLLAKNQLSQLNHSSILQKGILLLFISTSTNQLGPQVSYIYFNIL